MSGLTEGQKREQATQAAQDEARRREKALQAANLRGFDARRYVITGRGQSGDITLEMVQEYKSVFDMIDEDRSGTISVKELSHAARALGVTVKEHELERTFGGKSAQLTWDQFMAQLSRQLEAVDMEETASLFAMLDGLGDDGKHSGMISFKDLKQAAMIANPKLHDEVIQDMIATLDTSGDKEPSLDMVDFMSALEQSLMTREVKQLQEQRRLAEARILAAQTGRQLTADGKVSNVQLDPATMGMRTPLEQTTWGAGNTGRAEQQMV